MASACRARSLKIAGDVRSLRVAALRAPLAEHEGMASKAKQSSGRASVSARGAGGAAPNGATGYHSIKVKVR